MSDPTSHLRDIVDVDSGDGFILLTKRRHGNMVLRKRLDIANTPEEVREVVKEVFADTGLTTANLDVMTDVIQTGLDVARAAARKPGTR